jgi:TolB-like protein/AraC-like DNA-binding protein/Flp pilus assembly protein TadD
MTHSDIALLEKLDGFIDKNLDNPSFSVDDVCLELGVSRSQLHRVLIDRTQLSTTLYIRKRRLEKAKYLLSTTNLRISEISDTVGINSHPNFSKYFIEEFNASPTEFRKQVQEEKLVDDIIEPNVIQKFPIFIENQGGILNEKKSISRNFYAFVALFALLGIAYYFINGLEKSANNSEIIEQTENSVAILPFKNLGDTTNSYFGEGVMEEIHSSLASLNDLKIISTTSSNKYANTQKSISQIAQELHVNYLLSGTILQVEKQVRITVELIRVKDDRVVWTKNFEGDNKNIFGYMSIVAKEVAVELNQKLSNKIANKLDKKPTKSIEAYNEFLKGQQLIQTRTKEKIEASIAKFNEAIKLDPTFADAYSNLALAYYLIGEDQYMDVQNAYKLSEKNALTAIKLDTENGRAYAVLGNIYKAQNKWEQAITTYQIALKFSPNDAQITYWYSLTLRSIGQMKEAIKYSTKAVSLDPLASNIYGGHIIGCAYAGRFDLAEKAIKEGELIFNDAVLFHNAKAFNYLIRKNYGEALKELKICKKMSGEVIYYETIIAFVQGKLGQIPAVDLFLKTLPKIAENYKYFAIVYAGLDDKENCLKYLELAAENSNSPNYLKTSPLFSFLHNDSRFEAVLQKLGLLNPIFLTQ